MPRAGPYIIAWSARVPQRHRRELPLQRRRTPRGRTSRRRRRTPAREREPDRVVARHTASSHHNRSAHVGAPRPRSHLPSARRAVTLRGRGGRGTHSAPSSRPCPSVRCACAESTVRARDPWAWWVWRRGRCVAQSRGHGASRGRWQRSVQRVGASRATERGDQTRARLRRQVGSCQYDGRVRAAGLLSQGFAWVGAMPLYGWVYVGCGVARELAGAGWRARDDCAWESRFRGAFA